MSSIRIERSSNPVPPLPSTKGETPPVQVPQGYWSQLLLLFPTEVTAIYIGGINIIPGNQTIAMLVWLVLGVVATITLKGEQLKKHPQDPDIIIHRDWSHITISVISFLVWAYALGGAFTLLNWHIRWVAGLLVLAWTFAAPRLLKPLDKVFAPKKQ